MASRATIATNATPAAAIAVSTVISGAIVAVAPVATFATVATVAAGTGATISAVTGVGNVAAKSTAAHRQHLAAVDRATLGVTTVPSVASHPSIRAGTAGDTVRAVATGVARAAQANSIGPPGTGGAIATIGRTAESSLSAAAASNRVAGKGAVTDREVPGAVNRTPLAWSARATAAVGKGIAAVPTAGVIGLEETALNGEVAKVLDGPPSAHHS